MPHLTQTTFGTGAAGTVATNALLPQGHLAFLLIDIINFVLTLAAVLAVGFVVYGGFRYITGRGEEREIEAAKQAITGGVIGLVIIGLAASVVWFVANAVLS